MATRARGESFFPILGAVLAVLVVAGFGSALLTAPAGTPHPPALVQLHAVVTLGWFGLLIAQGTLIARGNPALHHRIGWASTAWAGMILVMGYLVTRQAMTRPEWTIGGFNPAGSAIFPFFDLLTFALFFALGFARRKDRAAHKRLMILTGVMMIDPAAARLGIGALGNPLVTFALELALVLALPLYDWRSRGRPHWASLLGAGVFVLCMALRLALGGTEAWQDFALMIYG